MTYNVKLRGAPVTNNKRSHRSEKITHLQNRPDRRVPLERNVRLIIFKVWMIIY